MSASAGALVGFLAAAVLVTSGAWCLSVSAGLIVAGVCVAALTVLAFVDVGGDAE